MLTSPPNEPVTVDAPVASAATLRVRIATLVVRARVLSPPPNAVDVNEEFWNSLPATH